MENKLESYTATTHKVHKLWEAIKELIGLENDLLKEIASLQESVDRLNKIAGNSQ